MNLITLEPIDHQFPFDTFKSQNADTKFHTVELKQKEKQKYDTVLENWKLCVDSKIENITSCKNETGHETLQILCDSRNLIEGFINDLNIRLRRVASTNQYTDELEAMGSFILKEEKNEIIIFGLATHPKNIYTEKSPNRIKGAGSAVIKKIIKIAIDEGFDGISLVATQSSVEFYKKMGFIQHPGTKCIFSMKL